MSDIEKAGMIYAELANITRKCRGVGKDSKNINQGYKFRGVDAVMDAMHPLFAEHRVVILPEVLEHTREERKSSGGNTLLYSILKIKFNFVAVDGSSVSSIVIGEGMDSGDKASNKAMAVALKYALTQMHLLPYGEKEPEADSPDAGSKISGGKDVQRPSPAPTKQEPQKNAPQPPAGEHPAVQKAKETFAPKKTAEANKGNLISNPETKDITITVKKVTSKSGNKRDGTPWVRYSILSTKEEWYGTFDTAIGEKVHEGDVISFAYTTDMNNRHNIVQLLEDNIPY